MSVREPESSTTMMTRRHSLHHLLLLLLVLLFLVFPLQIEAKSSFQARRSVVSPSKQQQKAIVTRGGVKKLIFFRHRRNKGSTNNPEGSSSFGSSIFNLVNNVAGAGILALSAGHAQGTGRIPALALCVVLGVISARTFSMIGEACEMLEERDFKVWLARDDSEMFLLFCFYLY